MIRSPTLGAPGIYRVQAPPTRRLSGVRMDVCAFVGVAPRGPARLPRSEPAWVEHRWEGGTRAARTAPVAVESWDAYVRHFGTFDGPGLLPYAVAAFFEQGGRRAYVARVVHDYGDARDGDAVASGPVRGLAPRLARGGRLFAVSEGEAGDGIQVTLTFAEVPLTLVEAPADGVSVVVDAAAELVPGATLRAADGAGTVSYGVVSSVRTHPDGVRRVVVPDEAFTAAPASLAVVEARVEVIPPAGAAEDHLGMGLSPRHPRWIARVLTEESALLRPEARWAETPLTPDTDDPAAGAWTATTAGGGARSRAGTKLEGLAPERDGLWLLARSEGAWGNDVRGDVRLDGTVLRPLRAGAQALFFDPAEAVAAGALVRFADLAGGGDPVLAFVTATEVVWDEELGRALRADLDSPVPAEAGSTELLEARLTLLEPGGTTGGTPTRDRTEVHAGLGLDPGHPRWVGKVLALESQLVRPDPEWLDVRLDPSGALLGGEAVEGGDFRGGEDRYGDLVPDDFFDPRWSPVREEPGAGVHALAELGDLSLLVAPDLYSPEPLEPPEEVGDPAPASGPDFAPCPLSATPQLRQARPVPDLVGLRLVPTVPADLETIVRHQRALVAFAEARGDVHALLSVPPGLSHTQVRAWRARFGSPQAAAYHPWAEVSRPRDGRDRLVSVPPAGAAAGVIAAQEWRHGVAHGPANVLLEGVVDVARPVAAEEHDVLHPLGLNVLVRERDGVRLTAARTLATGAVYRQLSVRRLVTMLARTLERQMAWTVFEPNGPRLRREVRGLVRDLLRGLYRGGALAGRTEEEAFFVRCDETLNPRSVVDAGRLVCQVGIAPAEPLEFITLLLVRGGDATLRLEE